MSGRPLSSEAREEIFRVFKETGCKTETARRLGINRTTVRKYLEGYTGPKPISVEDRGAGPEYKLRFSVRPRQDINGERWRVINIPDAHSAPHVCSKRFKWIGRHIHEWANAYPNDKKAILQNGDFLSIDSLCRFEGNETVVGRLKPSFENDIDAGHRDMSELDKGLGGFEADEKHVTLGNHEDRVISYTNRNPEVFGVFTGMLDNLFMTHGWSYSPFGNIYYLGGVGFTHYPLNTLGKPYGGKTALQRAANDVIHDLVVGHDHKSQIARAPKLGSNISVQVFSGGCCLPHGHVEKYIKHDQTSGWSYGIQDLLIDENRLQAIKQISMIELGEKYRD